MPFGVSLTPFDTRNVSFPFSPWSNYLSLSYLSIGSCTYKLNFMFFTCWNIDKFMYHTPCSHKLPCLQCRSRHMWTTSLTWLAWWKRRKRGRLRSTRWQSLKRSWPAWQSASRKRKWRPWVSRWVGDDSACLSTVTFYFRIKGLKTNFLIIINFSIQKGTKS